MIKLPKDKTKALVSLHGWSAVIFGFLLYAVVATGTVAVLAEEIRHWSVGHVKQGNPLAADIDSIVRSIAKDIHPEFLEDISIRPSPSGNVQLFFHTHRTDQSGQLEEYGTQFHVDPVTQTILEQRTGTRAELFETDQLGALSRFLVSIHTELHLPKPWGLLLTGVLGLVMLVAAISGFMMHRHLFQDIFVIRRDRASTTVKRDTHTVAGTWGLPFAFILAFTGCFFSFAGSFGIPAVAMVAFGGDQEKLVQTIFGSPTIENDEREMTANINSVLSDAHERSSQDAIFVSIAHFGRADAKISLFVPPSDSGIDFVQYEYNGASGEFIHQKPLIGTVPSIGGAAYALIRPLHFGHFAGLLSKAVWVALGFASCYVILSGFWLWIDRRKKEAAWSTFERFTIVFGSGLPAAMLICAAGYFIASASSISTNTLVPWSFCASSVVFIISGIVIKSATALHRGFLTLNSALCLLLPPMRFATGGPSWGQALDIQNIEVLVIDILLIGLAVFCFYQLKHPESSRTQHEKKQHSNQQVNQYS